jgi:hypothetical protein
MYYFCSPTCYKLDAAHARECQLESAYYYLMALEEKSRKLCGDAIFVALMKHHLERDNIVVIFLVKGTKHEPRLHRVALTYRSFAAVYKEEPPKYPPNTNLMFVMRTAVRGVKDGSHIIFAKI